MISFFYCLAIFKLTVIAKTVLTIVLNLEMFSNVVTLRLVVLIRAVLQRGN